MNTVGDKGGDRMKPWLVVGMLMVVPAVAQQPPDEFLFGPLRLVEELVPGGGEATLLQHPVDASRLDTLLG